MKIWRWLYDFFSNISCFVSYSSVEIWKMAPGTDDPRKLFILTTAGNYFSLDTPASLSSCRPLQNFLDDGNEILLTVTRNTEELQFSNKVLWVTYSVIYIIPQCFSHNKLQIFLFLLTDIMWIYLAFCLSLLRLIACIN